MKKNNLIVIVIILVIIVVCALAYLINWQIQQSKLLIIPASSTLFEKEECRDVVFGVAGGPSKSCSVRRVCADGRYESGRGGSGSYLWGYLEDDLMEELDKKEERGELTYYYLSVLYGVFNGKTFPSPEHDIYELQNGQTCGEMTLLKTDIFQRINSQEFEEEIEKRNK
jgi:hypothetical protein